MKKNNKAKVKSFPMFCNNLSPNDNLFVVSDFASNIERNL